MEETAGLYQILEMKENGIEFAQDVKVGDISVSHLLVAFPIAISLTL